MRQLFPYRADDPMRRLSGIISEVKGDLWRQLQGIPKWCGREQDYVEVSPEKKDTERPYSLNEDGQRVCRCWRGVDDMDLVELPPCMCPACSFVNIVTVEVMETDVCIGLESAPEGLQMIARMFALTILRVCKPDRWRGALACGAIIPNICPKSADLRLAVAGREYGHESAVGVQLATGENVLLNRVHQWLQDHWQRQPSQPEWNGISQRPGEHKFPTVDTAEDDR